MLHQFNMIAAVQSAIPVSNVNHSKTTPSQTELIKESRRHYLRYLSTVEDLVKCEIDIKRLENEDGVLAMLLAPTREYKVLQYKKDIAKFAIEQYRPIIASMATIAMMPIDENPFVASTPSAPPSNEMGNAGSSSSNMPITSTPPVLASMEALAEKKVSTMKKSKSF